MPVVKTTWFKSEARVVARGWGVTELKKCIISSSIGEHIGYARALEHSNKNIFKAFKDNAYLKMH